MLNLRKIEMTVQQIELIRAALNHVSPKALKSLGFDMDEAMEEIDLLDGMLTAVVDGDPEEIHAFWA